MLHAAVARRAYQQFERRARQHKLHSDPDVKVIQHQLMLGWRNSRSRTEAQRKRRVKLDVPHYGLPGRSVTGFPPLPGNRLLRPPVASALRSSLRPG